MGDPAINLELEKLMSEITKGNQENQEARDSLMLNEWMLKLLNEIGNWAKDKKHVEADEHGTDIQEIISARVRDKLHTVSNPKNVPWSKCLRGWCYRVGARRCEDVRKKRTRLMENYRRALEHKNTDRIQNRVRRMEPSSPMPSQDEELERKEQAPLSEKLESTIHQRTFNAFDSATPEEQQILSLWSKGKTLKQISKETRIPLSSVHRKLDILQRAIAAEVGQGIVEELGETRAEESGVVEVLEKVVKDRDDLHELLANSIEEIRGNAYP